MLWLLAIPRVSMHYAFARFLHRFNDTHGTLCHANNKHNQRAAVIIDYRSDYFLPMIMKNFSFFLGKNWNFYFFCTHLNKQYVRRCLNGWEIDLRSLDCIKYDVKFYNSLLKSTDFWQLFKEEKILIFQLDTILCSPFDEAYMQYDYIGAPCGSGFFNGGLSLRTRKTMIQAIEQASFYLTDESEDVFFTKAACLLGAKLPDQQTATLFSVETFYLGKPFGVHGTNKYYMTDEVAEHIVSEIQF